MPDASQIYDTIHLDVTAGGGFDAAQTKIQNLIGQLEKLGSTVTPIRIDTNQIDQAIEKLRTLSSGAAGAGMGAGAGGAGMGAAGIRVPGVARDITAPKYDVYKSNPWIQYHKQFSQWKMLRRRQARDELEIESTARDELEIEVPSAPSAREDFMASGAYFKPAKYGVPKSVSPMGGRQFKDIPAGTENLAKYNTEMAKIADIATNVGKAMPQIPPAISNVTNSLATAVPAAEAAGAKLDAFRLTGQDMKPALAEAATAQTNLKNAIVDATGKMPANTAELNKANAAYGKLGGRMDEAKGKTNAYTLSWKNMTAVMGKVAFWMVATGAIYGTIRAFKQALDIIIKVDHAMADIRKVYQGAPSDIKPLRNDLIELNVALGGNVEQSMEAAVGWARLGYKRREIVALMRTSMLAMNIAELNAADATQLLTAAMQQFKIPAAGAITVLDSWNELSNRTLATTRDLGDSVSIAGATFEQTGDSIHYLNAITATLVQTMAKSGREVGTAMRTLGTFMYRPQTIKKVKEITGVEIEKAPTPKRLAGEEQAEYTARMRDNMKAQSEVLGEVAAGWDNLKESEQISLAQSMAGVRRYNYFIALMENYDMVMDNLLVSINSVGSSERENAIYMDTLQKQIERLKSSFTKLYVAAGDGGLAGVLKGIVKLLTFLVSGFAEVNFTVPLITVTVLVLVNAFGKLIKTCGGFGNILRGFKSPMGIFNASLLAVGVAFTILESAAASAQKRLEEVKAATDAWIQSMDSAAQGIKTVAESSKSLAEYKDFIEMKYKPGSAEYTTAMNKYNALVDSTAEKLMLLKGITYDEAKARVEASDMGDLYTKTLDNNVRAIKTSIDAKREWLGVLQSFNEEAGEDQANAKAVTMAYILTDIEPDAPNFWERVGEAWDQEKHFKWTPGARDADKVAKATAMITGELGSLEDAYGTGLQLQMDAVVDEMDDVTESSGGAGEKIDKLQQLMELLSERLRGINRDTALVNHLMEFNNNILDEMESKYGAAAYATDGYLATLGEQNNYLEDSIVLKEAAIIKEREGIEGLRASREEFLKSGSTVKDYNDQMDGLVNTLHQDEEALQGLENQLVKTKNRGFGAFMDLMEQQHELARAPDVLNRVLPSRRDTADLARDISYIMDDLKDIGETTGKDIIGAMERWGIHANSIYISHDQINNMLMEINATQEEREAIEGRLKNLQDLNIAAAERLNQEYDQLSNTFQNIVDEGLFGIRMGEQTALDLAKKLGREYASIALKTLTQPATETFAAGMGGAAYFMKHGKLPPALGGGMADVKLVDGRVPVYDAAVAAGLASVAAGQVGGAAGKGFTMMGPMPAQAGPSAMKTIMPIAGGMITGGLMGSGGGAGGAAFGSMMGGIGAGVSLIPGWGPIAGMGISMLALLGNLFGGGPKHEEEDPYARQQSAGIGERSLTIGNAGTVNNYVYMTLYYESASDRENVSQLYDALEEEGLARGYQVTGNAAPATV